MNLTEQSKEIIGLILGLWLAPMTAMLIFGVPAALFTKFFKVHTGTGLRDPFLYWDTWLIVTVVGLIGAFIHIVVLGMSGMLP